MTTGDTIPESLDRRSKNRDSAEWIARRLDEQMKHIDAIRVDMVIGFQQVDGRVGGLDDKLKHLHESIIASVPHGDHAQHLQDHLEMNAERKEFEEDRIEGKRFRKDLIYKFKMGAVLTMFGLFLLGVVDWMRNFVLGVEQGKSSMELQKNEPVHKDYAGREATHLHK